MATYKYMVEVTFDKVPEDWEEVVLDQIREDALEEANPGMVYYEDDNGNEKDREIKEWNVTRVLEDA